MLPGLGYTQQVREGVTVTLSTLIDGKNFNQGGHKVGLALELESWAENSSNNPSLHSSSYLSPASYIVYMQFSLINI